MDLQETVFEHATGTDTFTVTASEPWSVTMVKRLKEERPDEVEIVHTNADGSLLVHFPFSWMRIVPKKKVVMTDEQRALRSKRMKALNSKQQSG